MLRIFIALLLLGLCRPVQAEGTTASQSPAANKNRSIKETHSPHPYHAKPNAPLWERYLAAGDQYHKGGDDAKAKSYYFQALTLLEKTPKAVTEMTPAVARLQHDILKLYPNYPLEAATAEGKKQINLDKEEISVLSRLNRLNQYFRSPGNSMTRRITTQLQFAVADLQKNTDQEEKNSKQE
jgi:hypothetical protein